MLKLGKILWWNTIKIITPHEQHNLSNVEHNSVIQTNNYKSTYILKCACISKMTHVFYQHSLKITIKVLPY